ncbi:MAG: 6-phosphogluconolactonase [Rubrivivax sp.]|nr:MAG: 6-phosphogluconolactonase [Rubrivivax sp.]
MLAQALADVVADQLRDGLAQRGRALLIVSGGNTPVPFFERLSQAELAWSQVSVTLADERWVPPSHADSNARLVQRHLLQGLAAQARWLPLVNSAATPAEGQPALEHALAGLPWPADVLVLGMGGDGHTASLFPHDAALAQALDEQESAPRCLAVAAPERPNVPVPRITMSRRALLDVRLIALHLVGADKWRLLHQVLEPGPVEDFPIRLALHQTQVPCHVFHAD